jgi:protein-S-isoprenylcysteine O-methyltransferase Ste14
MTSIRPGTYILSAALLLLAMYIVTRRFVRRDYLEKGRLTSLSSLLQLGIFAAFFCFPYLFNPPEWPWFWKIDRTSASGYAVPGLLLILLGFIVTFGTMFWFGVRRAFGVEVSGIVRNGPYRYSRNPQLLAGYFLVIGIALQRPSLYSLGWVILYGIIGHMMILTEEEHLRKLFGDAYHQYCSEVPRYLRFGRMSK